MTNTDFDWQIDEFMVYCRSTQLREKTMASYEQTLRLFERWCKEQLNIVDVDKVTEAVIRRYWSDSSEVFSGVDIKGGVSITLYDSTREFSPIGVMLPFPELFTIKNKVYQNKDHSPFSELFAPKYSYHFNAGEM